jgi:hypothetical protein
LPIIFIFHGKSKSKHAVILYRRRWVLSKCSGSSVLKNLK